MLPRLAGWCYDRRRLILAAWLLAVIGFSIAGQAASGALLKSFSLPGSESSRAFAILGRDFHRTGDTGQLVFRVTSGRVDDAAVRGAIEPVIAELSKQPHVASITSPYSPARQRFVSHQGSVAYAEIPHAQHAFDFYYGSPRGHYTARAVEEFLSWVHATRKEASSGHLLHAKSTEA